MELMFLMPVKFKRSPAIFCLIAAAATIAHQALSLEVLLGELVGVWSSDGHHHRFVKDDAVIGGRCKAYIEAANVGNAAGRTHAMTPPFRSCLICKAETYGNFCSNIRMMGHHSSSSLPCMFVCANALKLWRRKQAKEVDKDQVRHMILSNDIGGSQSMTNTRFHCTRIRDSMSNLWVDIPDAEELPWLS